jgi:predicted permease
LGIINNLIINYFKIIPENFIIILKNSNTKSLINNLRKYIKQIFLINFIINLFLKKIKTNDLIKLNNIDSISNLYSGKLLVCMEVSYKRVHKSSFGLKKFYYI